MKQPEDSGLSNAIKAQATRHELPPALHGRIVSALRQADSTSSRKPFWASLQNQWAGMGVAFACGVFASLTIMLFYNSPKDAGSLQQEIVAGHVRSMMVAHLSDVTSTDQHTVKPWFAGKLDYSPPVHDLAQEGFPLVGGRLDYLNQRSVAALVYQRRQHTINLFVWPSNASAQRQMKLQSRQGFNMTDWIESGMQFWAVSDLNAGELQTFSQTLRQKNN